MTSGEQTKRYRGLLSIHNDASYQSLAARDFYSKDFDGNARVLRNDLDGELAAEIQFVQSHSVAPNGNFSQNKADETKSRYMPMLTAQREALVLFLPQGPMPERVQADLSVHGEVVANLELNHPSTLPRADNLAGEVSYSNQAWWASIPWQHVRNGMALEFTSQKNGQSQSGSLAASRIDVGAATQLVLKNLRPGMLTNVQYKGTHWVLLDPVAAATDYFQTLPVSKLIIGSYADTKLDSVIIQVA